MAEVKGGKELDAKLKELGRILESTAVRASLRAALNIAKRAAKASVPVGDRAHRTYKGRLVAPGFASRSLMVSVGRPYAGGIRARLGVKNEAFYALQFLELGTKYVAANPWLVPAFKQTEAAQTDKMVEVLRKRIAKIAAGGGK